jgi:Protein of unknown function (DUF2911)
MFNKFSKVISLTTLFYLVLISAKPILSQTLEYPLPSPSSSVMQVVGITKVSVEYSSPGVKGRTIWGELVPYNMVWRTGANMATEISFSTDVKINGKDLAAGTYSLFTIPRESEWSVVFNSKTGISGGAYDKATDVLMVEAKPESGELRERMAFLIENNTNDAADIVLHWEKMRLVITIEVNTQKLILKGAAKEVEDSWTLSFNAANYYLSEDIDLEKGLEYATLSTSINEVYWNLRIKAQLEEKLGKKNDAIKNMLRAIELGSAMENAPFDFDKMNGILAEWQSE